MEILGPNQRTPGAKVMRGDPVGWWGRMAGRRPTPPSFQRLEITRAEGSESVGLGVTEFTSRLGWVSSRSPDWTPAPSSSRWRSWSWLYKELNLRSGLPSNPGLERVGVHQGVHPSSCVAELVLHSWHDAADGRLCPAYLLHGGCECEPRLCPGEPPMMSSSRGLCGSGLGGELRLLSPDGFRV